MKWETWPEKVKWERSNRSSGEDGKGGVGEIGKGEVGEIEKVKWERGEVWEID